MPLSSSFARTLRRALRVAGIALSLLACSTSHDRPLPPPSEPVSAAPPAGPARDGDLPKAPLALSVAEVRNRGEEIEIDVVVDRRTRDPVTFDVALPPGVVLLEGNTSERLEGDEQRVKRTLRLRLPAGTPAEDIRFVADVNGQGYGARATTAYRFGRAAPRLVAPERRALPTRVNGKRLGRAIPLD